MSDNGRSVQTTDQKLLENKEPLNEGKVEHRLRIRFPFPSVIQLMCADEDEAIALWELLSPILKEWECGGR